MTTDPLPLLQQFPASERRVQKNGSLFHSGDPVSSLFVVVSGGVDLVRTQEGGTVLTLQRAAPGNVLAEASVFSESYSCDAVASRDSTLSVISKKHFLSRLQADPDFALAWISYLARQVQKARFRSEILALRTVAERLNMWLSSNTDLPPRGQRLSVAREIGVSPEAFYRELAKRFQT